MPYLNGNTRKRVNRDYQRELHERQRLEGLCQFCQQPHKRRSPRNPAKLAIHCEKCAPVVAKRSREWQQKQTKARAGLGLCVRCGLNKSLRATSNGASKDKRCAACAEAALEYKETKRGRKHSA